ncbi:MAG: RnfABCDGE type electron transport complex subunit C [Deltaproteobacteria bacterium]|nr:RnfABCDGE type electron transport complex subunit C [Deltaproteobacteria bacterium]
MSAGSFSGGICLSVSDASANKPFERIIPTGVVTIPLKQDLGGVCSAKVKKGDEVKVGQVIGESAGPEGASIHATVSGKVADVIKAYPHLLGGFVPAVVIESDGKDDWVELESSADPLATIQQAGIIDFDINPVPLVAKLNEAKSRRANALIVNAMDIEPVLSSRLRLLSERVQEVARGIDSIKGTLGAASVYIAIDENAAQAISAIGSACGGAATIAGLNPKYPQAVDLLLVKSILGKEVPCTEAYCVADIGALVLSVETVAAVGRAVTEKKPVVDRFITVTGTNGTGAKNVQVRIGTPIKEVLGHCGISVEGMGKVISGGPMMGTAIANTETPVTKEMLGIFVQHEKEITGFDSAVCIKCGLCVEVCPVGLMPFLISGFSEKGVYAKAAANDIFTCFECGCCAYVCPVRIPMVHWIKYGKAEIMAQRSSE